MLRNDDFSLMRPRFSKTLLRAIFLARLTSYARCFAEKTALAFKKSYETLSRDDDETSPVEFIVSFPGSEPNECSTPSNMIKTAFGYVLLGLE